MPKPFAITFAGAIGASKTPIAYYLSWNLGIPVTNNDAIRREVAEDLGHFDEEEYILRRDKRLRKIIESGKSCIYDASIDRSWGDYGKDILAKAGYDWFIISLDLSAEKLDHLHEIKHYEESRPHIQKYVDDHNLFLQEYADDVGVHITDEQFPDRLEIALNAVKAWIEKTA